MSIKNPSKYNFSDAILKNIENTYTYAYAKNAHGYKGGINYYNPIKFFEELVEESPFDTFMELDNFAFTRTKKTLDKYGVPYTPQQERKAKVYVEVTKKMEDERSDYVSMYIEDYENTGVVLLRDPYVFTTQRTLDVAKYISELPERQLQHNVIYEYEIDPLMKKTKEQLDALKTCVRNKISCLIGGAGTGKSFVTAEIIKQLLLNKRTVAVLAPTHKAREALQKKLDDKEIGIEVKTIHSFVHRPFDCDAIVIDESGMLSTPLMHRLMVAYKGQQLLFVGDKNQLPPIGYGRPFELIQEKFVTAELLENKRSESGDIIALGREILGEVHNNNMSFPNIELVNTTKEAFERGAEVVLTYLNKNVEAVNEEQRIKNGPRAISPKFAIGDIIIAKTNNDGYYNGQLFDLVAYDVARNVMTGDEITFNNYRDLEYNFDLAYGLTIHKSQGSEWDVVAYQPTERDTQNLAYVAVSRAKKKLIIVGEGMKSEYLPDRKWKQLQLA